MNCNKKWADNLDSLNDAEFGQLLDHAETCKFHSNVLDRYEADEMPFVKLAYSMMPEKSAESIPARIKGSYSPRTVFHDFKGTTMTCYPKRHQPKGRTVEEQIISEKVKEIMDTGSTIENCRRCVEFLEQNEYYVKNSWSHTLNKARALTSLGEKSEAKRILQFVLDKYRGSREASGSVFEIYSWHEELEYNEGGKVDSRILDRRMNYVKKGLQFYPENYMLLINAFETAWLKNEDASVYFNKLKKLDEKYAEQYLLHSPIKDKIIRSDENLGKAIIKLSSGLKYGNSLVN